ncbi:MAG: hypothetical protein KAG97_08450, partial [Victivallales bacterium]|nr:hypothetical protein [Victivallales bacterium]
TPTWFIEYVPLRGTISESRHCRGMSWLSNLPEGRIQPHLQPNDQGGRLYAAAPAVNTDPPLFWRES